LCFQEPSNHPDDDSDYVRGRAKVRDRDFGDRWRVENCDGKRYHPDLQSIRTVGWGVSTAHPQYLADPETQEGQKLGSNVVEAAITACFEDSIQEESCYSDCPEHHECADDDISRMKGLTEK
jgi:hypothetical protein